MKWRSAYREDVRQYTDPRTRSSWKSILLEPGLWASLQYRLAAAVYRSRLRSGIKAPLRLLLTLWQKIIEITTGISLPCTARIGPGLHLPHCGTRIVHGAAVLGPNCCISQGVTIGISGRGPQRGVPVIGARVYFGVNAVVVGQIEVGDDVVIGANSLVNRTVPSHHTVLGVPAVIVSANGSADYLAPAATVAGKVTDSAGRNAPAAVDGSPRFTRRSMVNRTSRGSSHA